MRTFALRVFGRPRPQGSTTAYVVKRPSGKYGAAVTESDPSKAKAMWRTDVVHALRRALEADPTVAFGTDAPVHVHLVFVLPRLASMPKTARGAKRWPTARNADVDKLARSVLDACTIAGLWGDDAQVVELVALKRYAELGEAPGCELEVAAVVAYVEQQQLAGLA